MPAKDDVQFKLNLPGGELVFPEQPVTIPADAFFFWPFDLDLGGAKLVYATAQPVCKVDDGKARTFYFAETPGVKAEFVFDVQTVASMRTSFQNVKAGRKPAFDLLTRSGQKIQIVLLSEADSLALFKDGTGNAAFEKPEKASTTMVKSDLLQSAGPAREISLSRGKSHIAIAPTDADFTNAAIWKIILPRSPDLSLNPLLRIHYLGDVARLTLNGKLIDDDFYSGRNFEIGLKRYAPDIFSGDLRLEILPLHRNAPIFFEPKDGPDFGTNQTLLNLGSVEIITHP
jgi:hypothetical protein